MNQNLIVLDSDSPDNRKQENKLNDFEMVLGYIGWGALGVQNLGKPADVILEHSLMSAITCVFVYIFVF